MSKATTAPSTYTSIRDDSILSTAEREFVLAAARRSPWSSGGRAALRTDGRSRNQLRPIRLFLGRSHGGGGGGGGGGPAATCTAVAGGGTRVFAAVAGEVVPARQQSSSSADHRLATEGVVALTVDFSPAASTLAASSTVTGLSTDSKRQRLRENEVLRTLERLLLTGGAFLDREALCVAAAPDAWVWRLNCSVTVQDEAAGNVVDAAVHATVAALRHVRMPHAELGAASGDEAAPPPPPILVPPTVKKPTPLPLHHTPLTITFALLLPEEEDADNGGGGGRSDTDARRPVALMDPTSTEQAVQSGSCTVGVNAHGELCLLDCAGCEVQPSQLRELYAAAAEKVPLLVQALERTLREADDEAWNDQLRQLQRQQRALPPLPAAAVAPEDEEDVEGVPFRATQPDQQVRADDAREARAAAETDGAAEELYRQQALDYNLGHRATSVKEQQQDDQAKVRQAASSLLQAMLQSVQQQEDAGEIKEEPSLQVTGDNKKISTPEQPAPRKVDQTILQKKEVSKVEDSKKIPLEATTEKIDSDEEEAVVLKSEFESVQLAPAPAHPAPDDDDIDDLAAAIKTKKKKKKKGKKS